MTQGCLVPHNFCHDCLEEGELARPFEQWSCPLCRRNQTLSLFELNRNRDLERELLRFHERIIREECPNNDICGNGPALTNPAPINPVPNNPEQNNAVENNPVPNNPVQNNPLPNNPEQSYFDKIKSFISGHWKAIGGSLIILGFV